MVWVIEILQIHSNHMVNGKCFFLDHDDEDEDASNHAMKKTMVKLTCTND